MARERLILDCLEGRAAAYALSGQGVSVVAGGTVYYSLSISDLVKGMTPAEVGRAAAAAWADWATAVPLHFVEVPTGTLISGPLVEVSDADIAPPLDVLAYTTILPSFNHGQPGAPSVVFDSENQWTADEGQALATAAPLTLRKVLEHEFGHVLGLGHEDDESIPSIMGPRYTHTPARITDDDIAGVFAIYGGGTGSVTPLPPPPPPHVEAGAYDPAIGWWYLGNARAFAFGGPGYAPVTADWGGIGHDTVGVVDTAMTWYLRDSNTAGGATVASPFHFGSPGEIPIGGDWFGVGHATPGVYDPATATFTLKGTAPFQFGSPGWLPLTGDWAGNGKAGVGAYDPATGNTYLSDGRHYTLAPHATPVTGAWDNGKADYPGTVKDGHWQVVLPSGTRPEFSYGGTNLVPLAGLWR